MGFTEMSIRRRSQQIGLSGQTTWHILRKNSFLPVHEVGNIWFH